MADPSFYVITCIRYNLVFQAHFSQLEMPVSDYVTDLKSVLDQSIRIIQAMIDISANSGWLSSARTCMHLLQMVMQVLLVIVFFHFSLARIESVTQWLQHTYQFILLVEVGLLSRDTNSWKRIACMKIVFSWFTMIIQYFQGLWFNRDSSLWMLPCMNNDLLSLLSKRGISNVQQLLDLPRAKLQMLLQSYPTQQLHEVYLSQYRLNVTSMFMHWNNVQEYINICR